MKDVQDIGSSPNLRSMARSEPGQVVLVLQGGGALGSYQAGVYQALHEAGIEPDCGSSAPRSALSTPA
jgi:NTE family protein